jgi:hypothetical protein
MAMLGGCESATPTGQAKEQPLSEHPTALHMEGCDWKPDATLAGRGGEGGAVAAWEWAPGGAAGKSLAPRLVSIPTPSEDTYNLYWDTQVKHSDIALEVRVQARTGEIDQGGGPIWRVQDRDHYYICRVNPLESNFRLYKVVGGVRRQLDSVQYEPKSAESGAWHTIRVTHVREKITCRLDDKYVLKATDTAILNAGGVGVWTKADAVTAFEGFSVRRIQW